MKVMFVLSSAVFPNVCKRVEFSTCPLNKRTTLTSSVTLTHALLLSFPVFTQNIREWVLLLLKIQIVALVIHPETIEDFKNGMIKLYPKP